MVLASFACKKEAPKTTAQQSAQKAQAGEAQKQQPQAAPKSEERKVETTAYSYDPQGRRDPFFSIIVAAKKDKEVEKKKKGLKPAEAFDVADIKLIAVAGGKNDYSAMVQLPDKKYFTVREGTVLGLYGGKVVKIDLGSVVIREYVKDYRGEIKPKDTILRLRKEEGE